MGEGEQRRSRRTARYDSRELALLSSKQTPSETEWDEKIAAGSQKVPVAALDARTKTVDDPLTTSVLAEVARQSTIEVSADEIAEVADLELDDLGPGDDPA